MKKKEWMLGLRAVTTRSLGQLLEQEAVVQGGQEPGHGVEGGQVYCTGDISSVVHLVTHHHTWDWSSQAYKVNILSSAGALLLYSFLADLHHTPFHQMSSESELF